MPEVEPAAPEAEPPGPAPVKAGPSPLKRSMSANEGFQCLAEDCRGHMVQNAQAVIHTRHPEAIHQMRVAIRRLRSLVRLFRKPLALDAEVQELSQEFGWLARELGPARDWDVFMANVLHPAAEALGGNERFAFLIGEVEGIRERSCTSAAHAIRSRRAAALGRQLERWIRTGSWRQDETGAPNFFGARPIRDLAGELLAKRYRRVLRGGRSFARIKPEERHALRLEVKPFRYALEFFAPLYGAKVAGPVLSRVRDLQDELGYFNDGTVALDLLRQLEARRRRAALRWELSTVEGWFSGRPHGDEKRARRAWKAFRGRRPFWT